MVFMFKLPRWLGKLKWKHKDLRKQRTTEEQGRKPCSVISSKCGTDRIHKNRPIVPNGNQMDTSNYILDMRWYWRPVWGKNGLFNKQCQERSLSIYIKLSQTLISKPTLNGLKTYQRNAKPQSFLNNILTHFGLKGEKFLFCPLHVYWDIIDIHCKFKVYNLMIW